MTALASPPLPPSLVKNRTPASALEKIELRPARRALSRRPAARSTAVRTPPARAGAIRTRPRSRGAPHQAERVGATWRPRTPSAALGPRARGRREKWEGSGWARGLATRGADRAARARWRLVRSAGVASRATAGACGLCRRISARVAHACSALIMVARERYLKVATAILIYEKDTERSKNVPNTLSLPCLPRPVALRACAAEI